MSVSIIRTRNYPAIRELLIDPEVYPYMTEDLSPPAYEFKPPESEVIYYLAMRVAFRTGGLCMFMPINGVTLDGHIAVLPEYRGAPALEGVKKCFEWIWENTPYARIEARVPDYNRAAIYLANLAGMKRFGVSEKSFLRGGLLHDQVLLGISKGES